MKKVSILILSVLFLSADGSSQVSSFRQLGWEQPAVDLSEAQAATYKYYIDSTTVGENLSNVNCGGTASPFQCVADFPASTPGTHVVTITAVNAAGESSKSNEFKFSTVVIMAAPINLRGIQ